ncbi:GNAT family N-acetyltransferase [Thermoplasmatales archaeon SW_10_69_26]|nr:MAG: GNAT family N-acetyltransferase [Thermoplasmatales archaeon SW_10_69_26]
MSLAIEPARDELALVRRLLAANGLPHADVHDKPQAFHLIHRADELVGAAGLEIHDPHALLRSLVFRPRHRGHGHGTEICRRLERRAQTQDVQTMYLLTTTAAGFFRQRGYEVIKRTAAPAAIQRTSEFSKLCPASATCMAKPLDSSSTNRGR